MSTRTPIFTVTTPVPIAQVVTLWDNTWNNHIEFDHPEMSGKTEHVRSVLVSPTFVCEATNPNYIMFVSHQELDEKGHPLAVCVSTVDSSGRPAVATAYYGKKYLDFSRITVVWQPS